MAKTAKLTEKQQRFVEEYLIDLNATQAAIRAGYSAKTADQQGSRMLANVKVQQAISVAMAERSKRTGINQDRVVLELARIAFVKMTDLVDSHGRIKDGASEDDLACIESVKYKQSESETGSSVEREVKISPKLKALELLGKHLGIEKVELYDLTGVHLFILDGSKLIPDVVNNDTADFPHVTMTDAAGNVQMFNWQRVPLIPLKANEQETPLIKRVKSLQDGINVMLSDFENNMQEDARNTILVLKNYDGTNLGEFRKNLATFGAVKVRYDGDTKGGVETLEITVNADNYKVIVEIFKKALIENAMGYDAKDDRLSGNPNQMNIQSMYSDIDTDANDTESEAQATMDDILWFVNCHLANSGMGDFEGQEDGVDVIFNRDMLMNESEIIDNCTKSQGLISDETIIANHPWVDDPQAEMERLKKQKEEAQKEMLAQYDPFGTQNDDPDNKGDPSQGSQGGEVDE